MILFPRFVGFFNVKKKKKKNHNGQMKVFFWESPPDLIGRDKNFDMFF